VTEPVCAAQEIRPIVQLDGLGDCPPATPPPAKLRKKRWSLAIQRDILESVGHCACLMPPTWHTKSAKFKEMRTVRWAPFVGELGSGWIQAERTI
jgi:hypothetical protein